MQSWKIGDIRVTKVVELEAPGAASWIVPQATPENLARETWLQPHFADAEGNAVMSVHSLVVETSGQRILVDTCIGNDKERVVPDWNQRSGPFLSDLEKAGFPVDSIDTVMCTHLHVDHVGWNTRLDNGRWVPTFPRARYLFNEKEYAFWRDDEEKQFGDVFTDSVKPVFDAGLVDLVGTDHVAGEGVAFEPTPGHTPGHVSVRIRSRGEDAVITGDLMHHPVQCAYPDWDSSADVDPTQARSTRHSFLERYGDSDVLVVGTHFAGPTAGHIVRHGPAYRFNV